VGAETLVSRSPWVASPDTDGALTWGLGAEIDLNDRAGLRVDLRQGLAPARLRRLTASYEAHAGFFVRFGDPPAPTERRIYVEGPPAGAKERAETRPRCGEGGRPCPSAAEPDAFLPGAALAQARGNGTGPRRPALEVGHDEPAEAGPEAPEAPAAEPHRDTALERLAELADQVRFAAASADLDPASEQVLAEMVSVLAENPTLRLEIAGHTDATGPRSLNIMLSHARALQVVRYLVEGGIAAERLDAAGYGPDRPVDTNDTAEGRAANRRIEIRPLDAAADEASGAP
jgi:outer membrane protein OmpA-like peptidoglycan-associated protein